MELIDGAGVVFIEGGRGVAVWGDDARAGDGGGDSDGGAIAGQVHLWRWDTAS